MTTRDKIVTIACLIILTAMATTLMGCDAGDTLGKEQAKDYLVDQCERERLFLQCMDKQPLINMTDENIIYECDQRAKWTATRYRFQFTQHQLDNCAVEP